MNVRKTIYALIILVVLAAVALLVRRPVGDETPETPESTLFFPDFNRDAAAKIAIKARSGEVELRRSEGKWVITDEDKDYPVDKVALDRLLEKVETLERGDLVSENSEKQSLFQVDSQGTEVQIFDESGGTLAHFFLGKTGPDFFSTYVRKEGSDKVYVVAEYLRSFFDKPARSWKDRSLIRAEKDQVAGFTISRPDQPDLTVERDGEGWKITSPEEAPGDKKAIDRIVNSFKNMLASSYSEETDPAVTGLDEPQLRLTVRLTDHTTREILFGNEVEKKGYYAKRGSDNWVFIAPKYRYTNLNKTFEDLKAEPEPTAVPTAVAEESEAPAGETPPE